MPKLLKKDKFRDFKKALFKLLVGEIDIDSIYMPMYKEDKVFLNYKGNRIELSLNMISELQVVKE